MSLVTGTAANEPHHNSNKNSLISYEKANRFSSSLMFIYKPMNTIYATRSMFAILSK